MILKHLPVLFSVIINFAIMSNAPSALGQEVFDNHLVWPINDDPYNNPIILERSVTLQKMLFKGGLYKWNNLQTNKERSQVAYYIKSEGVVNDLLSYNLVDGLAIGPHITIGKIKDFTRLEFESSVKYSCGRSRCLWSANVRWLDPNRAFDCELRAGHISNDFDCDGVMDDVQKGIATSIIGWNHFKYVDRAYCGISAVKWQPNYPIRYSCGLDWTRNRRLDNAVNRSLWGHSMQSNIPKVYGHNREDLENDSLLNFPKHESLQLQFGISYRPKMNVTMLEKGGRIKKLVLGLDYACSFKPGNGSLDNISVGHQKVIAQFSFDNGVRYYDEPCERYHYSAAIIGGVFCNAKSIYLTDFYHFNASLFGWHKKHDITRFSLLDNYEYSTNERWIEAHTEYLSSNLLLTRFIADMFCREYLQVHSAVESHRPVHTEIAYGWAIGKDLRMGWSCAFRDSRYYRWGFHVVLDLEDLTK